MEMLEFFGHRKSESGGKNSGGKKTPGFPLFLYILLLPPLSDFS